MANGPLAVSRVLQLCRKIWVQVTSLNNYDALETFIFDDITLKVFPCSRGSNVGVANAVSGVAALARTILSFDV